MDYSRFLKELERADLTIRAFAELIGMNPNSISNYAKSGEVPTHLAVIASLVGEMSVRGLDFRGPIGKIAPTPKKPRGRGRNGHFGGDRQVPLDFEG